MRIQYEEGQLLCKALAYELWFEHREILFVHYKTESDPRFCLSKLVTVKIVGDCDLAVPGPSLISVYTTLSGERAVRCQVHTQKFSVDDIHRIISDGLITMNHGLVNHGLGLTVVMS